MAGLEPAATGGAHLALPSSELHDHINCFRAGETHAQLRSECGSYIVRARSLTKLATSTPDQECDCLANPVANFIDNIIWVCGFISDGKRIINRRELWTQTQLSNQLAHWWSRPELNRRTRSFNPLLYRLSYRTMIPCLFMPLLWFSRGAPPCYIGQGIMDIILKRVGFEPYISSEPDVTGALPLNDRSI